MCFKSRNLTISSVLARSTWKKSTKPKLTLQGDWMQEAGFRIGANVRVTVEKNKLIIENGN
jgi:hypothetical protein